MATAWSPCCGWHAGGMQHLPQRQQQQLPLQVGGGCLSSYGQEANFHKIAGIACHHKISSIQQIK
jgi:hypothetical protein